MGVLDDAFKEATKSLDFTKRCDRIRAGYIVTTDDLTQQPVRKPASYSEAAESLRQLKQQDPAKAAELKILRLPEVKQELVT